MCVDVGLVVVVVQAVVTAFESAIDMRWVFAPLLRAPSDVRALLQTRGTCVEACTCALRIE